jgi:ribosomal protein L37AE/L43A
VKKELCPHCATKNLIRVDTWTVKCKKCGFER